MQSILKMTLAALAVAPVTMGHTWIEQLRNINDNGSYVGEYGYPRGMVSKTDPTFTGFSMNFEIPAYQGRVFINESTVLCHEKQRQQTQSSDKYPRLQAVPGGFIAMRYMENGHITKPNNQLGKPEKAGTIFVYGTTTPDEDERIVNVLKWTKDGSGGDKRGTLLAMNDFDDGRCYEKNDSPVSLERQASDPNFALGQVSDGPGNYPLFCETDVQLPATAPTGKPYTFYWVWQWNTAPDKDPGLPAGKDEYYTTCIDVDVTSGDTALAADAETQFDLGSQQDAMSVAVKDFASRTAVMTDAMQGEVGPVFTGTPSASGSGGVSAMPTVSASVGAPFGNATSTSLAIPTLSTRPGATLSPSLSLSLSSALTPSPSPSSALTPSLSSSLPMATNAPVVTLTTVPIVTVTDIYTMTVTAPAALAPRSVVHRHGARFRGVYA
ncbi:hypothetical protein P153DRAFT_370829 [Dothidotthia symphoricarpi CBS 119687]|uniref:DUF7492 domain-containing protein n=1 Tax=Dothidotthia symphoricarpi CBS 119687 TaxID=1392245 RepID=A0A6A5ZZQ8_9PLEO|nr:uncharacterized protein P153DRAFT_370829 [Dothidotthia symphoricarpi CBS 119687]KAF2124384.1 hypothetical protein P153DRAFT_370829 [Dothidotthia symphoricarpi CBS 119687]